MQNKQIQNWTLIAGLGLLSLALFVGAGLVASKPAPVKESLIQISAKAQQVRCQEGVGALGFQLAAGDSDKLVASRREVSIPEQALAEVALVQQLCQGYTLTEGCIGTVCAANKGMQLTLVRKE